MPLLEIAFIATIITNFLFSFLSIILPPCLHPRFILKGHLGAPISLRWFSHGRVCKHLSPVNSILRTQAAILECTAVSSPPSPLPRATLPLPLPICYIYLLSNIYVNFLASVDIRYTASGICNH